jgi:hypothetical protein
VETAEGKQTLVLDGPLDGFAAREVHGLSQRRGEVDIPLLAGLAMDELDFGGKAHGAPPDLVISLDMTECNQAQHKRQECGGKLRPVPGTI